MYRFALRPRWLLAHLVVLALAGAFALAGVWQLNRLDERRARNELVQRRSRMPEAPLTEVLRRPDDVEYRVVLAKGGYDTAQEVVLLGRDDRGRPGNHVLTPLVTEDGNAILVDRGWVPPDLDRPPVKEAAPPESVAVAGVLLPSEASPLSTGRERVQRIYQIDVKRLARQIPYPTYSVYLHLVHQVTPAGRSAGLPEPARLALDLGEGPHLIYAIQWFAFIAIALAGYGALLRREARKRAVPEEPVPT